MSYADPMSADYMVEFISGVTAEAKVAAESYATWIIPSPPPTVPPNYAPAFGLGEDGTKSLATKFGNTTLSASGSPGGTVTYVFEDQSNWSLGEQQAFLTGLELWSSIANITFKLADPGQLGQIKFARGWLGEAVTQTYPGMSTIGGATVTTTIAAIVIDTNVPSFGPIVAPSTAAAFDQSGGHVYHTIIHEIGHALGLGHSGAYRDADGLGEPTSRQNGIYDSQLWTAMSYIDPDNWNADYFDDYPVTTNWGMSGTFNRAPTTPMMLDIQAIQRLYGEATSGPLAGGGLTFGYNSNVGGLIGNHFNFLINQRPIVTLWSGGIGNTLDLSGSAYGATINLSAGSFSSVNGLVNNVAIAAGTVIETAIGTNLDDTINGTAIGDRLFGNGGADTLNGGLGDDLLNGGFDWWVDTLNGGSGNDTADYGFTTQGISLHLGMSNGVFPGATGAEIGADIFFEIENAIGGSGNDRLEGDSSNTGNELQGRDGSDWLSGGLGVDWLFGGNHNDELEGGGGGDVLHGGNGVDAAQYRFSGSAVMVNLKTNSGSGGDAQGDTFIEIENLDGSDFGDVLIGDDNPNQLRGFEGRDSLKGGGGVDTLFGGNGDDTLTGGGGDDILDGGENLDIADYSQTASGVTVYAGSHFEVFSGGMIGYAYGRAYGAETGTDSLYNIENVVGGSGRDTLIGDDGANRLRGGGNDDDLTGGDGIDTADYSDSSQGVTVYIGAHSETGAGGFAFYTYGRAFGTGVGSDTLRTFENVIGGSGNDFLMGDDGANSFVGGLGDDEIDGGVGLDTADYSATSQGVTVYVGAHSETGPGGMSFSLYGRASGTGAGNDTLRRMENVIGGSGNDNLFGDENANVIAGGLGNDIVDGGGGFDFVDYSNASGSVVVDLGPTTQQNTIYGGLDTLRNFEGIIGSSYDDILLRGFAAKVTLRGGDGHDRFHDHNAGNDTFEGGNGNDVIDYSTGGTASVIVNLALGRSTSVGGSVNTLSSIEDATGSSGNDLLIGDGNANVFAGGDGHDDFEGAGGLDTLVGGIGTDTARFSGSFSSYVRTQNSNGSLTVTDWRAGSPDGTDVLRGIELLQFADGLVSTVNANQTAEIGNTNFITNRWASVDDLTTTIRGMDGRAITQYQFLDAGLAANSAYFYTPQNPQHGANTYITINASDLGSTWIRGGQVAGSETMWVRAFDGADWSAWDPFTVTTVPNTKPIVAALDHSAKVNQWVSVGSLLNATDADGDSVTQYQFLDVGMASSSAYFWTPQNAQHAANAYITVNASDIGTTWIRGGQAAGSETMWVRVFDGSDWSNWDAFSFTTTSNTAPQVTIADHSVGANQWAKVDSWISKTDADGDALTQYQFYDAGVATNSGYFWTPQNAQHPTNTYIAVEAADLGSTWVRGGPAAGAETMWVRGYDGTSWSAWDPFLLTSV